MPRKHAAKPSYKCGKWPEKKTALSEGSVRGVWGFSSGNTRGAGAGAAPAIHHMVQGVPYALSESLVSGITDNENAFCFMFLSGVVLDQTGHALKMLFDAHI